jgi:hypothetical protein
MNDKNQLLNELNNIFNRWQELLTNLSEEEIMQPLFPSTWTVKDTVVHLWAWQQASLARAEAALQGTQPEYPQWWVVNGPDPNEDVDRTNQWIYEANKANSWLEVYADWKAQFEHYLRLTRKISEKDLFEPGRFSWMGDYPLAASPLGLLDHHQEHIDSLTAWLQDDGR